MSFKQSEVSDIHVAMVRWNITVSLLWQLSSAASIQASNNKKGLEENSLRQFSGVMLGIVLVLFGLDTIVVLCSLLPI